MGVFRLDNQPLVGEGAHTRHKRVAEIEPMECYEIKLF